MRIGKSTGVFAVQIRHPNLPQYGMYLSPAAIANSEGKKPVPIAKNQKSFSRYSCRQTTVWRCGRPGTPDLRKIVHRGNSRFWIGRSSRVLDLTPTIATDDWGLGRAGDDAIMRARLEFSVFVSDEYQHEALASEFCGNWRFVLVLKAQHQNVSV